MPQQKFYAPLPTLPAKTDITRFDGMVEVNSYKNHGSHEV